MNLHLNIDRVNSQNRVSSHAVYGIHIASTQENVCLLNKTQCDLNKLNDRKVTFLQPCKSQALFVNLLYTEKVLLNYLHRLHKNPQNVLNLYGINYYFYVFDYI
jgi:hypothetical protein